MVRLNTGTVRRPLLYALYVAIIVVLVLAIIIAFKSKSTLAPGTSTTGRAGQSIASQSGSSNQSGNTKKSGSSGPGKSSAQSGSAAKSSTGSSSALTNTGPGDVVGLFVMTSLAGAAAFSWHQRKKLS